MMIDRDGVNVSRRVGKGRKRVRGIGGSIIDYAHGLSASTIHRHSRSHGKTGFRQIT